MRIPDIARLFAGLGGRSLGLVAALAVSAAVALIALPYSAGVLVLGLHGLALTGVAVVWRQARATRQAADKMSSELDAISGRLIGLETYMIEAHEETGSGVRASVAEVTGEIGLLGSLVRDLAMTVASQDREVAELKDKLKRLSAPVADSTPAEPFSRPAPSRPRLVAPTGQAERSGAAPVPPSALRETAAPARSEGGLPEADARRMAAAMQAFESDRIELHLQPIVALPQRKVAFYEALARLRLPDESILVPAEFLPLVERLGHAAELDRKVLVRAMAIARHLAMRGSEAMVSCNLSPRSLAEPGFLRSVTRIVEAYPDTAGRVVFELSQRCWRTLDAERAGALASLRERGVPFALDRAIDLRLDPLALADRGVRFVKLPAEFLLEPDTGRGLDIEMADLATVLRRAGIKLIAERVEREETVPDLIDINVPLAQGFLFAPPRAVRPEVLTAVPAEPAPEPAPEREALRAPHAVARAPEAPSPEPRLAYRSFLRRAG